MNKLQEYINHEVDIQSLQIPERDIGNRRVSHQFQSELNIPTRQNLAVQSNGTNQSTLYIQQSQTSPLSHHEKSNNNDLNFVQEANHSGTQILDPYASYLRATGTVENSSNGAQLHVPHFAQPESSHRHSRTEFIQEPQVAYAGPTANCYELGTSASNGSNNYFNVNVQTSAQYPQNKKQLTRKSQRSGSKKKRLQSGTSKKSLKSFGNPNGFDYSVRQNKQQNNTLKEKSSALLQKYRMAKLDKQNMNVSILPTKSIGKRSQQSRSKSKSSVKRLVTRSSMEKNRKNSDLAKSQKTTLNLRQQRTITNGSLKKSSIGRKGTTDNKSTFRDKSIKSVKSKSFSKSRSRSKSINTNKKLKPRKLSSKVRKPIGLLNHSALNKSPSILSPQMQNSFMMKSLVTPHKHPTANPFLTYDQGVHISKNNSNAGLKKVDNPHIFSQKSMRRDTSKSIGRLSLNRGQSSSQVSLKNYTTALTRNPSNNNKGLKKASRSSLRLAQSFGLGRVESKVFSSKKSLKSVKSWESKGKSAVSKSKKSLHGNNKSVLSIKSIQTMKSKKSTKSKIGLSAKKKVSSTQKRNRSMSRTQEITKLAHQIQQVHLDKDLVEEELGLNKAYTKQLEGDIRRQMEEIFAIVQSQQGAELLTEMAQKIEHFLERDFMNLKIINELRLQIKHGEKISSRLRAENEDLATKVHKYKSKASRSLKNSQKKRVLKKDDSRKSLSSKLEFSQSSRQGTPRRSQTSLKSPKSILKSRKSSRSKITLVPKYLNTSSSICKKQLLTRSSQRVGIDNRSIQSTKSLRSSKSSKKSTKSLKSTKSKEKIKKKRNISKLSSTGSDFGKMKNYQDVIVGPDERRRRSSKLSTTSGRKSKIPRSSSPSALNKKIRVDKRTLSEYRHTCDYLEGQIQNLKKQHKEYLELKVQNQRLSNHIDTIKMDHELDVERLTKKIDSMEMNLKNENQKMKEFEQEQSTEYTTLKSEKIMVQNQLEEVERGRDTYRERFMEEREARKGLEEDINRFKKEQRAQKQIYNTTRQPDMTYQHLRARPTEITGDEMEQDTNEHSFDDRLDQSQISVRSQNSKQSNSIHGQTENFGGQSPIKQNTTSRPRDEGTSHNRQYFKNSSIMEHGNPCLSVSRDLKAFDISEPQYTRKQTGNSTIMEQKSVCSESQNGSQPSSKKYRYTYKGGIQSQTDISQFDN